MKGPKYVAKLEEASGTYHAIIRQGQKDYVAFLLHYNGRAKIPELNIQPRLRAFLAIYPKSRSLVSLNQAVLS